MKRVFDPKHPGERVTLAFDFTNQLPAGVTVQSADSVTISVDRGADADPEALLVGAPGLAGADLLQMVEGGLAGTDYRVTAWVTLSDTQQRALPAILPVRDIT